MPAACGYNPFDDDSTQPSYDPPSEAGNNSSLDEIERARICRSMDSNSNGSRQRRVSPDTRCYATVSAGRPVIATSSEHFQRLSHEFSRAGTRETSRTQKPGHQYDVERPPPSRAGRSRKVAVAVGATSQTLSRPLIRSETSPSKPRFEAKRLSKRPNELHAQSSSSATKTANGNVGFCTILFLLMLSAVTGYLVGRNGMGKVGAYVQEALSTIADFRPSLDQFQKETQFNMTQPEDSHRWPNNGMGLELTLLFAADEKWYKFFAAAVDDWNNSSSLSLATENVTADPDCTPVDGVMKVCNKDWGSTGWNGINYAMVDSDGIITSSVANMNDHYLKWSRDPQKQYVMCHEIGHGTSLCLTGLPCSKLSRLAPSRQRPFIVSNTFRAFVLKGFGLPHTDESFWNRDLGNCMDYTMVRARNQESAVDIQ